MNPSVDSEELIIIICCLLPFAAYGIVTMLQGACGRSPEHIARRQTTKHKVDFEQMEAIRSQSKVQVFIGRACGWDTFEVSDFYEICGDYSMAILGLHIFNYFATKHKLTNTPAFSYDTIVNFFTAVQATYRGADEVPFHNALHALDTMQKNYCLLRHSKFATFPYVEMIATVCGMSCHDLDHDSTNNQFHRQTNSHLVQKHGGECPLEMHHAEVGWNLVMEHLIPHVAQCDKDIFLHVFNSVILGTDTSHHAAQIEKLQSLPDDFSSMRFDQRVLLLSCTVHAADVSNPARDMEKAEPWIEKVYMEFAETGRQQRQRNLEVSMLCEEDPCVNSGQVGFIKWIRPLFQELGRLLPDDDSKTAIDHLKANQETFEARLFIEKDLMASARRVPSSLFNLGSQLEAPDSFMDIGTCVSTPEEDSGSLQFDPEDCLEFPTYSPPEKSPQFLGFPSKSPEIKIIVSNFSCSPDSSSAFHVPSAPSSPPPEPSPSYELFLNSQFPDTPDHDSSAFFEPMHLTPSASIIDMEHEISIHI